MDDIQVVGVPEPSAALLGGLGLLVLLRRRVLDRYGSRTTPFARLPFVQGLFQRTWPRKLVLATKHSAAFAAHQAATLACHCTASFPKPIKHLPNTAQTIVLTLLFTTSLFAQPPRVEDRDADWQKRMLIYPQREELPHTLRFSEGRNVTHFSDVFMDLGYSTEKFAEQIGAPDVHLPPRLACGEGEDPENGTLLRVLNRYGVLQTQFSAFPPGVKGGVQVATLRANGRDLIATAPFAAAPREVRVFDDRGLLQTVIPLPDDLATPIVLTSGRFLDGPNEVMLVAPRDQMLSILPIAVLSADGRTTHRFSVPRPQSLGTVQLTPLHETDVTKLLAYYPVAKTATIVDLRSDGTPLAREVKLPQLDEATSLYDSAYANQFLLAAKNDDRVFSKLDVLDTNLKASTQDVGRRENTFFSWGVERDQGFVRRGGYGGWHKNVPDIWRNYSATRNDKLLLSENPLDWFAGRSGVEPVKDGAILLFPYWSVWLNAWTNIGDIKGPDGLSAYNTVNAEGRTGGEGSVFKGDVSIDRQLLVNSRVFYWLSARNVRGLGRDAENLIGVNSLHELGAGPDYKTANIREFHRYLKYLYGTMEAFNARCKTPFTTWDEIDPPRNKGRGDWDMPSQKNYWENQPAGNYKTNPFWGDWCSYSYEVQLSTRFSDAKRDTLLSGFAPELVKNHRPHFGKSMGHNGLTMGTSTGGSVYSPLNEVAGEVKQITGVNSSGQWNYTYGEYQNYDLPQEYVRLKWQWKQGLVAANMQEPISPKMLAADGEPRPGQTGGVGQIRAVSIPDGPEGAVRFNIAQIGVGPDRNGLLKSLTEDGRFEGSTYVVPFHAKVQTTPLAENRTFSAPTTEAITVVKDWMLHNDQVEVTFTGSAPKDCTVTLGILHGGDNVELLDARQCFRLTPTAQTFRYAFRNQIFVQDAKLVVKIEGTDVCVSNFNASWQRDLAGSRWLDAPLGTQHRGGVSFDVLDRTMVATRAPRGGLTATQSTLAKALPADTVPPQWTNPRIKVRFPLDAEINAVGLIPTLDPDYHTWFTVQGARDDDMVAGYRVYDANTKEKLIESRDSHFSLPPLPPLEKRAFLITAFDRANNESKDGPQVEFVSPGLFDFGAKKTTWAEWMTLVRGDTIFDGKLVGWEKPGKFWDRDWSWNGHNTLNSEVTLQEEDRVLKIVLPDGEYRVSPMLRDGVTPTAVVKLNGVDAWRFAPKFRYATVEPFIARVTGGQMALTFPKDFGLLGLVIAPSRNSAAPQWAADVRPKVEALGYQPLWDKKPPFYDFTKATMRLSWPSAKGARSYRVIVNDEPRSVTNLNKTEIYNVPVDTPLSIRIDAVDKEGRVAPSQSAHDELDTRLNGTLEILSSFPKNDGSDYEACLNGEQLPLGSNWPGPMSARFKPGRNVLAVKSLGSFGGPKVKALINVSGTMISSSGDWKFSLDEAPNWQAPGFDDASWKTAYQARWQDHAMRWAQEDQRGEWATLQDAPRNKVEAPAAFFRMSFTVDQNAPRGGILRDMEETALRALEGQMSKLVIQKVSFAQMPLSQVIDNLNGQIKEINPCPCPKLAAAPALANIPITREGTNIFLRDVLKEIAEQSGGKVTVKPDGTVMLDAK